MMLLSYFGLHGVTTSLPKLVLVCDSYFVIHVNEFHIL